RARGSWVVPMRLLCLLPSRIASQEIHMPARTAGLAFLLALLLAALVSSVIPAQSATPKLPSTPFDYANARLPAHYLTNDFPESFGQFAPIELDNTPKDNPTTDHGAT